MQTKRSHTRNPTHVINLQKVPNGFQVIEPIKSQVSQSNNIDQLNSVKKNSILKPQSTFKIKPFETTSQPTQPNQENIQTKDWFLQNWESIIPASARWFKLEVIHQIEYDALPEFFHQHFHNDQSYYKGNYKTPLNYIQKRNQIIMEWINGQNKYLKFTDCLNIIGGDAPCLLRIYTFLEHWGLINFQYNPNNLPNSGYVYQMNGNFLERIKVNFQNTNRMNFHSEIQINCDICNANKITYQQQEDSLANFQIQALQLCQQCYSEQFYPKFLKQNDFQPISQVNKQQPWQLDEILKLLELVYKYKERWNEIAKQFSKRSLTEVVKMYLSLPYSQFFPSLDKEQTIPRRPVKENITFHNDLSNPIQLGVACFKEQMDQLALKKDKDNEFQIPKDISIKQNENKEMSDNSDLQTTTQWINVQLEKIEEQINYLEQYENIIQNEKLNVINCQKKNLQQSLQSEQQLYI